MFQNGARMSHYFHRWQDKDGKDIKLTSHPNHIINHEQRNTVEFRFYYLPQGWDLDKLLTNLEDNFKMMGLYARLIKCAGEGSPAYGHPYWWAEYRISDDPWEASI